ncbi:MAG: M18 family aminopeptidase [bacterium]|nr:M18 family aminopeptidase [bacterium]
MSNAVKEANELIEFSYENPTGYHVVENVSSVLKKNEFKELCLENNWTLQKGKKYFITKDKSALFAFTTSTEETFNGFKIVGSHIDSPAIKIKPNPEILKEGCILLNTEVYGGPILSTWFDRPLSLAGRVFVKSSDVLKPDMRLVNINKPLAIISNIAIHMNREINTKRSIDNQKELLPILSSVLDDNFNKNDYLLKILCSELSIVRDEILDFELFLYEYEKGSVVGTEQDFISSSRIDDQEAVLSGLEALINTKPGCMNNLLACFDNEEVGSGTKQGADSQILSTVIERIVLGQGGNREDFLKSIEKSFLMSIDGAHAVHPNIPEKADPINRPKMNGGPVVKVSANYKYTSDSESIAVVKNLGKTANIPLQYFTNHSNEKGGSTIGPLSSQHIEMRSIDVGIPMMAMHSIRELAGVKDHHLMIKLLKKFYEV